MTPNLLLSLFPGADLLGRGFEAEGYCVVRGPDRLLGQGIESFTAVRDVFEGVIGGSPCQDFSRARRSPPTGDGVRLLGEFARVVTSADPQWWLLENVPGVPNVEIAGYHVQRFNLNAKECGVPQNRLRRFQFGSRDGMPLAIQRLDLYAADVQPCRLASDGTRSERRTWADFCELQGLPRDFDLPHFSVALKYRVVGNGVPVPMARVVAIAIRHRCVTPSQRLCVCECGRPARPNGHHATAACRKRMERRRRVTPGLPVPRSDTVTQRPCHSQDLARLDGHTPQPSLWDPGDESGVTMPVRSDTTPITSAPCLVPPCFSTQGGTP